MTVDAVAAVRRARMLLAVGRSVARRVRRVGGARVQHLRRPPTEPGAQEQEEQKQPTRTAGTAQHGH